MRPLSVKSWTGTILAALVPVLNLAFLLYWSFGSGVDPNRRNFSRAGLIVIGLLVLLALAVFVYMVMTIDPHERIKAFMMVE
ncbi:MAG TPA: hypothetical protein VHC46_04595 [Thermodesulfobacteriota bacterium]|nr:hypothetical protein [Thermodesulfobacteriota bacterium]